VWLAGSEHGGPSKEVEVKNASLLTQCWVFGRRLKKMKMWSIARAVTWLAELIWDVIFCEVWVDYDVITSYSFYTFSLGIRSVAEEGCLELLFYVAAKIAFPGV
jgi:hypothetical protein